MSISIKPLEDRIVIRQVEAEQTTASGQEFQILSSRDVLAVVER